MFKLHQIKIFSIFNVCAWYLFRCLFRLVSKCIFKYKSFGTAKSHSTHTSVQPKIKRADRLRAPNAIDHLHFFIRRPINYQSRARSDADRAPQCPFQCSLGRNAQANGQKAAPPERAAASSLYGPDESEAANLNKHTSQGRARLCGWFPSAASHIPIIFSVLIDTPGSVMAFGEVLTADWRRHLKCLFRLTSVSRQTCRSYKMCADGTKRVGGQTDEGLSQYGMEM